MMPVIRVAHLFPVLDGKLIELLRSLDAREWERPTIAGPWTVKDVAAHLLDTQQRQLRMAHGEPLPSPPVIRSNADLVAFINRLNADGVERYRRLDTPDLIARMEAGGSESASYYASLDPFANALFPVSWAGEETSPNWFHVAREFTERWHHQQQIRLATNRPGIMTPELYYPVLDCFMRALPFAYRDRPAAPDSLVQVNVAGDCGGSWYLHYGSVDGRTISSPHAAGEWRLVPAPRGTLVCEITMPEAIAWRIFTKGISRTEAAPQVRVDGDAGLGSHILATIAIVG
ncbi:MAG TPA: maleylpyruvate isomerase N-terminal domain-containing protein [Vicinamibacterales bacterium]|nr:maleylpyruvate isomerase N-terminal domain-containing protein [Vicinamibacterales bacterium]